MSTSGKLLVIDEETYLLRTFVQLAESAGYRVEGSPDPRNGWDLARRLRPDLILVNTLPPEDTGEHLCRKVKADPVLAHTAIMLLAGSSQSGGAQPDLPGLGVDEYILKPITSRDLLARVQAMLRVKHSEAQLAQIRQELQEKHALLVTAQQQLRTSQKQTRQVLSAAQPQPAPTSAADFYETLPVGCCTVDKYGFITAANTLAAQYCGAQRAAFAETLLPDYLADEDVGTFFEHLALAFESQQPQTCQVTLKDCDVQPRAAQFGDAQPRALRLETRIQPASDADESARCTIVFTDVTTHVATIRQQHAQVTELRQQLQLCRQQHETRQRPEAQQRPKEAKQRVQPNIRDQQAEQAQIDALLRTQERLRTTLETHYVSQDTHDRKVKELQRIQDTLQSDLNSQRCRLDAMLDNISDGVTLCDITGYFDVFNARMQAITGYSQEEANAHTDFQYVLYPDPRHYQQAVMRLAAITASGEPQSGITTIRAKDGAEKTLTVYTIRIACGQQAWLLSTYQDITAYRQLKQKLIRSQKRRRKSARV